MIRIILFLLLTLPVNGQYVGNSYLFGGDGFSAEALQAFSQLGTQPSIAYKNAIADLVDGLVAQNGNDWVRFDQLNLFNLDTKNNAHNDISEDDQTDMTEVGTIVFFPTVGLQGTGLNDSYLKTNFQPNLDADDITATNAVYGVFVVTAMTDTDLRYMFGARDSQSPNKSQVGIFDDSKTSGELQGWHHDDSNAPQVATTAVTAGMLLCVVRDGTSNAAWVKDGSTILATDLTSPPNGGLLEREIVIFGNDSEGTIVFETDPVFMIWFICSGDVDLGGFKTLLETYKTAIDAI